MSKITLSGIRRSVVFAAVSDVGEVAVMSDYTANRRIYGSVSDFERVRYRVVVASTKHHAKTLGTRYYVFPIIAPGPTVFSTPADFTFKLFRTGVATPLEEVLAAKHACLRFNAVNVV